jgi:exodeoxyribonuclease-3
MSLFKIATWNVNSLRVRLPHVLAWLAQAKPDVLALQELKMPDEGFPFDAFKQAGYHAVCAGQKTYNGVAILSLATTSDVITDLSDLADPQRRVLCASIGKVRVLDLYVPNGESVSSEKYQYKLSWLNKLDLFLKNELIKYPHMLVLGDFNIAPTDIDVHDPKLWEGRVLCSDKERQAFQAMLKVGFKDTFRDLNPTLPGFSWWDYRVNAFKRKMGLRIDHILASNALAPHCIKSYVDQEPRSWERPSDHAPVVAEFNLA